VVTENPEKDWISRCPRKGDLLCATHKNDQKSSFHLLVISDPKPIYHSGAPHSGAPRQGYWYFKFNALNLHAGQRESLSYYLSRDFIVFATYTWEIVSEL
jgi:hypothetical protein